MGIFGKMFEKKNCAICGDEIGLLGNRKLEDGNLCKKCAAKLSPFFSDRRRSTVEQIREQLDYREANKQAVAAFKVTRTLGNDTKVLLDEDAHKFCVTSGGGHWRDANPDILDFSQVTGCNVDVRENRNEMYKEGPDGTQVSYDPPRYNVSNEIYITISVNAPYFDEIEFRVNDGLIEGQGTAEFRASKEQADEIREALTAVREETRSQSEAASAPKTAVTCPHCGATTIPTANGCCEYCGGAIG